MDHKIQRQAVENFVDNIPIDDGQCVIDVLNYQSYSSDFASFLEIRYAAEQVLKKCVDPVSSPAKGGFIGHVGM